jgi:hypothetical protein
MNPLTPMRLGIRLLTFLMLWRLSSFLPSFSRGSIFFSANSKLSDPREKRRDGWSRKIITRKTIIKERLVNWEEEKEHERMARGGRGLPKVSPGPAMPYSSTPCRQATLGTALWPFQGWSAEQSGRPSSTLLDTRFRTPMRKGTPTNRQQQTFSEVSICNFHE